MRIRLVRGISPGSRPTRSATRPGRRCSVEASPSPRCTPH